jgi:hypothetical protein
MLSLSQGLVVGENSSLSLLFLGGGSLGVAAELSSQSLLFLGGVGPENVVGALGYKDPSRHLGTGPSTSMVLL